MTWATAGQVAVILSPLAFLAYKLGRPYFLRLRLRRHIREFNERAYQRDYTAALEIDRAWDRTYGRAQLVKAVQHDLEDSSYQERARRAEALGFMGDDAA